MPGYEVRVDEYTPARKRSNVDEEKKIDFGIDMIQ